MLVQLRMGRAAALKEYLAGECGILIRDASNFEGLNEHFFRIATQTPEENNELIRIYKEMDIFVLILPLLAGWLLDKLIGDPSWLPHPIVGFGKLISFCEKRWNKGKHRVKKGACTAVVLIVFIYGASALLIHGLYAMNLWIGVAVSAVLIFYCLAGTTLINEVRMVFVAATILWRRVEDRYPALWDGILPD